MDFDHTLQPLATDALAAPAGAALRCAVANFRWERGVSEARAAEYHAYVGDAATHKDWKAEHKGYLGSFVHVAKDLPRSAESFMDVNAPAHLNGLDNTFLLRLESLEGLFNTPLVSAIAHAFWQRFFRSQKDLRKDKLSDADEALRAEFTRQWNTHRTQARPLFATFLNEFGGDIAALAKEDWPHLLRDRLGLTHWPSTAGKPLPVALMCYTVNEVREARLLAAKKGAVAGFARPTVLDNEMSPAFIPAPLLPGGESYGYTLDLGATAVPAAFTPELLTFPLDYQPRHLKALGFITREHALHSDDALLAARNRHVQGLQELLGCADFGEVLA